MNEIYGVDLTKKITPIMVRKAIVICFQQAHKEVLDLMDKNNVWKSEKGRETFRHLQIEQIIKKVFIDANVDYYNPKKEELIKIIDSLAQLASMFRKPDIIKKHYNEINQLMYKLE